MHPKINGYFRQSVFIIFVLPIFACSLWPRVSAALVAATPTAAPALATATLTPTALPPTPTFTVATAPSFASLPSTSTSEFNFDDLTPYYQAMLPQFAGDVDAVAQAGASRYYLQVRLDLPQAETSGQDGPRLTGLERVRYTNTETTPLAEIYFNLYPNLPGYDGRMGVQSVAVAGQVVQPELKEGQAALRVPLAQPLAPGAALDLTLTYTATVPTQTDQGYNIFSASDHTLALAGFYPAIAVYDQTGWNVEIPPPYGDATYLDTSLYRVEVTVPDKMVVAASGSVWGSQINPDGTKTLSLVSGPMRDFYLVGRIDYQLASQEVNGVKVNSYYPPTLVKGGELALRYALDALQVYSRDFGPYPYAEFDVVATPTIAGGVEYPGIVVIAQNLYDQEGGFFEHAIVHEVAHQWWYGLVGNDQVDHPWLDESLTNYSTILYWEEIEGPAAAKKILDDLFLGPYQYAQEQNRDRAVTGPVADYSAGEYGLFVYGKGPLFFNALRQEVGHETYLKIMETYFAEYKYETARPDDLINVIERVSGRNIEPLVETWLVVP